MAEPSRSLAALTHGLPLGAARGVTPLGPTPPACLRNQQPRGPLSAEPTSVAEPAAAGVEPAAAPVPGPPTVPSYYLCGSK